MDILIRPEILEKVGKAGYRPAELAALMSAVKPLRVELFNLGPNDFETVFKVLGKDNHLKSKIALSTMRKFRDMEKLDNPPIHQLPDAVIAFKSFIKKSPLGQKGIFLVFQKDETEDIWDPYVVTNIIYHPLVKRRTRYGVEYEPAYVRMHGAYYDGESVQTLGWSFYSSNVKGKDCVTAFREIGLVVATQELADVYVKNATRYKELEPQIGLKCLASGWAVIDSSDSGSWWRRRSAKAPMATETGKTPVVIDIENEDGSKSKEAKSSIVSGAFWYAKAEDTKAISDPEQNNDDEVPDSPEGCPQIEAPLHPYLTIFDLVRHEHASIHISYLEEYKYDSSLGSSLVLPKDNRELIEALVGESKCKFQDIIAGKSGGTIVLCAGEPGTGKTLTAEVYSEVMGRPLYSIQSSQLGVSADELETTLKTVLARSSRWNAILLIDEADVFIHSRGEDIEQNAIVGIFLRVLEYYNGVLFLTTNRATVVDDAIASRCTAMVTYEKPTPDAQSKIWAILAEKSKIPLAPDTIKIAVKSLPQLSGRDIKNLLKLSSYIMRHRKLKAVDFATIKYAYNFHACKETK